MNPEGTNRSQILLAGALIAVFAGLAVLSAAFNGIPFGNDLTQHYQFAATVEEALSRGEMYPALSPLSNNGAGDYGIRFYPPAGYYLLAFCYKAVGGWFAGSILAFFLIFFAGGTGVYLWAREEFGNRQALIASALYVFAPYHLNQLYNNFLFGELSASAVIPFCFLFVHRTIKYSSVTAASGLAISYAILILTHLPSLIFCSAAFAIYGLVRIFQGGEYLKPMTALAGSVLVGVGATSFYWIKLVTELDWINHSRPEYFSNIYGYANNFLLRPQNIFNAGDDVLAIWMADLMLLASILICLPTLILLIKKRSAAPPIVLGAGLVAVVAAFMSSVLSRPLWDHIGFLTKIQFPWRWLGVVSIAAALVASHGINAAIEKREGTGGKFFSTSILAATVVFTFCAVFVTKQSVFIPSEDFSDSKVRAMLTGESRDCWWTVWADDDFHRRGQEKVTAQERDARVVKWDSLEREIELGPGLEGDVRFTLQYYPHWRAYVDGTRIPVTHDETGFVSVRAPAGAKTLNLRFREPDTVRAASVVSASAWALAAFALVFSLIRRTFRGGKEAPSEKPQLEA